MYLCWVLEHLCPTQKKEALKPYTFSIYSTIDALPKEEVEALILNKSVYFKPTYLRVMEKTNPEITFRYVQLFYEKELVGFASFQIIQTRFSKPDSNLSGFLPKLDQVFQRLFGRSPLDIQFKVLVCGNAFITGEHGIVMKDGVNKNQLMNVLSESIIEILKRESNIKLVLLKDFVQESLSITNEIKDYGYSAFRADQNMVFELPRHWANFQDYKAALKAKYRTKLNKAFKDSKSVIVKEVDTSFFAEHISSFIELYNQVEQKASFHLGAIEMQTFVELKRVFKDSFLVKAYFIDQKMVAYLTAFKHHDTLDAHFIGLDYKMNRKYALYQRILYDYVQIALDHNLKRIKFGRTASEIKSTLGAVPTDLTLYVKHVNPMVNFLTKRIVKQIRPSTFDLRKPFKQD